jgi:hypothetical protein
MAAAGSGYNLTIVTKLQPDEAMQTLLGGLSGSAEYTVNAAGSNTIILTRRYTPTWAIVVAVLGILLFLIGLLALLVKNTETLTLTIAASPDGSRVSASGVASRELAARLNGVMNSLKEAQPSPALPGVQPTEIEAAEETKRCPQCAETVKAAAKVCRFCQFQFDQAAS